MCRPIVLVPGLFAGAAAYRRWSEALEWQLDGVQVFVVPTTTQRWAGTLVERYALFLPLITATVERARRATGASTVALVGHSAGGRLARLWLCPRPYGGGRPGDPHCVDTLVMLGAANATQEPWSRRAVAWVNRYTPGAYHAHVRYITVVGRAVAAGSRPDRLLAALNYRVQGAPDDWGDGVIPVSCAALPGATNLVLDGIWHLSLPGRPGYESPIALARWAPTLI